MPISDWPVTERPRERLLAHGAERLSDAELLAILLRTGCKGSSALDLARTLLGEFGSLQSMLHSPPRRLQAARGLGQAKAAQLAAALELARRSLAERMTERSVLRLAGERADKKVAHWQSVAVAACEQCGGNRVPTIYPVQTFTTWLKGLTSDIRSHRLLLSLRDGSTKLQVSAGTDQPALFLSGPEGGLSIAEEDAAVASGFSPVTLGPRVLRAETAALAALTTLVLAP